MKANELIIGDFVTNQNYENKAVVCKIIGLSKNSISVEFDNGSCLMGASEDSINPIPLTKEILEKNFTFDKDIDLVCHLQYDLYIQIDNTTEQQSFNICNTFDVGYGREYNYIMNIQYVHELQHLLRLIEYEKYIIL